MKTYFINCISSTSELIDEMVEQATEISYSELLNHVEQSELDELFPIYQECPLTLEKDYTVSYYKSVYDNIECVYVEHSRVEYIFV